MEYRFDSSNRVWEVAPDGPTGTPRKQWEYLSSDFSPTAATAGNNRVFAVQGRLSLSMDDIETLVRAFDRSGGDLLWSVGNLPAGYVESTTLHDGVLLVASSSKTDPVVTTLTGLDAETGSILWQRVLDGQMKVVKRDPTTLWIVCSLFDRLAVCDAGPLDAKTGNTVSLGRGFWSHSGEPGVSGLVANGSLTVFDLNGESIWSKDTSDLNLEGIESLKFSVTSHNAAISHNGMVAFYSAHSADQADWVAEAYPNSSSDDIHFTGASLIVEEDRTTTLFDFDGNKLHSGIPGFVIPIATKDNVVWSYMVMPESNRQEILDLTNEAVVPIHQNDHYLVNRSPASAGCDAAQYFCVYEGNASKLTAYSWIDDDAVWESDVSVQGTSPASQVQVLDTIDGTVILVQDYPNNALAVFHE